MSPTTHRVLLALALGPADAVTLARRLCMWPRGVRRALEEPHRLGLVTWSPGEPKHGKVPRVWRLADEASQRADCEAVVFDSLRSRAEAWTASELAEHTGRTRDEVDEALEALVQRGVATSAGRWVRMYRAVAREEAA